MSCDKLMMLKSKNPRYKLRKLRVGARLRCPHCEVGPIFDSYLKLRDTCPYCDARYERGAGESIGGIYVNIIAAETTAFIGFLIVHTLFSPPITQQLMFWVPYLIVFSVLFYRRARGVWIAILYLTGAVYADPDYTREYFGPTNRISTLTYRRSKDESA